jgi:hypothetical protein
MKELTSARLRNQPVKVERGALKRLGASIPEMPRDAALDLREQGG